MANIHPWQEEIWRKMAGAAPGHAILLKGRKGLGKLDFARDLARYRLCENPSAAGRACGTCASCCWFDQGSHPNFRMIEPETQAAASGSGSAGEGNSAAEAGEESREADAANDTDPARSKKKTGRQIKVAQIRSLEDFIHLSRHQNGWRIILIHPAETMNLAAANALLKNLEEPPAQVMFILVAHQAQHLPPTIRSRCRQVAMPAPAAASAAEWLAQQGVSQPGMDLALAGYAPLAALEFSHSGYREQHSAFIERISAPGGADAVVFAEEFQKSDPALVINWLQKWCYDLMSFCTTMTIRYHPDRREAVERAAAGMDLRSLSGYLRTLAAARQLASHPLNPRLFLEELLISYPATRVVPHDQRAPSDMRG